MMMKWRFDEIIKLLSQIAETLMAVKGQLFFECCPNLSRLSRLSMDISERRTPEPCDRHYSLFTLKHFVPIAAMVSAFEPHDYRFALKHLDSESLGCKPQISQIFTD
jgi:hypothetical protein